MKKAYKNCTLSITKLSQTIVTNKICTFLLQEDASLTTNFTDQKVLVITVINLDINLKNKILLVIKIITIMNKKL